MNKGIKKEASHIYTEYQQGYKYKNALGIYDQVKKNEDFVNGKQWEGVNAPNIELPVINICLQWVNYATSMLVSDDVSIQVDLPEDADQNVKDAIEYVVSTEIEHIFEQTKFKSKTRQFMRNCATDGDACFYWRYNPNMNLGMKYPGGYELELLDNTNVHFSDPTEHEVQKQEYIIVVQKLPLEAVRNQLPDGIDPDTVHADTDDYNQNETNASEVNKYVTVLTKLFKENGTVHAIKSTKDVILKEEVDTGLTLYPVAWMNWQRIRDSYHGMSKITAIIPNQIMINKYYMMVNEFMKKLAFPKIFYDGTKIKEWSNKVEAIKVTGNPNEAYAVSSPNVQLSAQVIQYVENLIEKTKESLGIYDVAIGNARPENTSAIIALQKTASQPLELQKLDYYQVVEDCVRIVLDIMSVMYGVRNIPIEAVMSEEEMLATGTKPGENTVQFGVDFDYSIIAPDKLSLIVEVGASAYWTEIMQTQTLDNMFRAGIIPDAKTYVEQLPPGLVRSKKDILDAIERVKAEQMMMQQQLMAMQQPQAPQVPGDSASAPVDPRMKILGKV